MAVNQYCPLRLLSNGEFVKQCNGDYCAWYDKQNKCCCVLSIIKNMNKENGGLKNETKSKV